MFHSFDFQKDSRQLSKIKWISNVFEFFDFSLFEQAFRVSRQLAASVDGAGLD
jgi:hypothetical protein